MDIISFIVKFGMTSTAICVAVAYNNKPQEESFDTYYENICKFRIGTPGIFSSITGKGIVTKFIQDVIIAKVAIVKEGNNESIFIGAFDHWYPLKIGK